MSKERCLTLAKLLGEEIPDALDGRDLRGRSFGCVTVEDFAHMPEQVLYIVRCVCGERGIISKRQLEEDLRTVVEEADGTLTYAYAPWCPSAPSGPRHAQSTDSASDTRELAP